MKKDKARTDWTSALPFCLCKCDYLEPLPALEAPPDFLREPEPAPERELPALDAPLPDELEPAFELVPRRPLAEPDEAEELLDDFDEPLLLVERADPDDLPEPEDFPDEDDPDEEPEDFPAVEREEEPDDFPDDEPEDLAEAAPPRADPDFCCPPWAPCSPPPSAAATNSFALSRTVATAPLGCSARRAGIPFAF